MNHRGDLWIHGSLGQGSDRRLKKDIRGISNALDKVSRLNGVSFKWKKNDREDIELIAQEVEEVVPAVVTTDEDTRMKTLNIGRCSVYKI